MTGMLTDPASGAEAFLSHAIKVEEEAALRFGELADAMRSGGNGEAARLFAKLAEFSRLHLADARARAGYRIRPVILPEDYAWPDLESPEAAAIWAADPMISKEAAMEVALEAEERGLAFYRAVAAATRDPEVRALASEFAAEEAQHVQWMRRWMGEEAAGFEEHGWVDALTHVG